jgi:hypothetical protein
MEASVATTALAATIHDIGRGSGVMLLYMKVLKNWFSTPQANAPRKPKIIIALQVRLFSMFPPVINNGKRMKLNDVHAVALFD